MGFQEPAESGGVQGCGFVQEDNMNLLSPSMNMNMIPSYFVPPQMFGAAGPSNQPIQPPPRLLSNVFPTRMHTSQPPSLPTLSEWLSRRFRQPQSQLPMMRMMNTIGVWAPVTPAMPVPMLKPQSSGISLNRAPTPTLSIPTSTISWVNPDSLSAKKRRSTTSKAPKVTQQPSATKRTKKSPATKTRIIQDYCREPGVIEPIDDDDPPLPLDLASPQPDPVFKVPAPPPNRMAKTAETLLHGRLIEQIYQAYLATMVVSTDAADPNEPSVVPASETGKHRDPHWILNKMKTFYPQVADFEERICKILEIPYKCCPGAKMGMWLEALVLRTCWYSQKKFEASREPDAIHRRPLYFEPNCTTQMRLNINGDTAANGHIIDALIDYHHVLLRRHLDEVELGLCTAFLLFSISYNTETVDLEIMDNFGYNLDSDSLEEEDEDENEDDATSIKKTRAIVRQAIQNLLVHYQKSKKVKKPEESSDGGSLKGLSIEYQTMQILLDLAELTGVVAHFYLEGTSKL